MTHALFSRPETMNTTSNKTYVLRDCPCAFTTFGGDLANLICSYLIGPLYIVEKVNGWRNCSPSGGRLTDDKYWIPRGSTVQIWEHPGRIHTLIKTLTFPRTITATWRGSGVTSVLGHSDGSLTVFKGTSFDNPIYIRCPAHAGQKIEWIFPFEHGFITVSDRALICWSLNSLRVMAKYERSNKRSREPFRNSKEVKKPKFKVTLKQYF